MKKTVKKEPKIAICRRCGGRGVIEDGTECEECAGSGRVWVSCEMEVSIRPYKNE